MTGYPAELLDLDLDLEADLGVDTVKQAEVFAAVRERYGVERDDSLKLRDFPTLTHVIGWIRDRTAGDRQARKREPTPRLRTRRSWPRIHGQRRHRRHRPDPAPGAGARAAARR